MRRGREEARVLEEGDHVWHSQPATRQGLSLLLSTHPIHQPWPSRGGFGNSKLPLLARMPFWNDEHQFPKDKVADTPPLSEHS